MSGVRLSASTVDAIESGERDAFVWDRDLRGFGVKVTRGGAKTYVVQYRMGGRGSPTRRYTIGRHGSPWTAIAARREAERILLQAKSGNDPQASRADDRREKVDLAFDAYAERFLAEYGKPNWKPKTFASAASNMRRWIVPPLRRLSLPGIKRRDITAVLDKIPTESQALRRSVYALMRKLFAWAVARGDIEKSPCDGMTSPAAVASRDRVLDEEELCIVLHASMGSSHGLFGVLVRFLLFTGQRRDEVAGMRWEELDQAAAEWVIPKTRTKNSREHKVPLNRGVVSELNKLAGGGRWPQSGFVFTTTGKSPISGFSKMKMRLDREIAPFVDMPPWRLHDLRRSMATGFQAAGVRFEITEAILNHVSGSRAGVAGIYQRYEWHDEKRAAMDLWADRLLAMVRRKLAAIAETEPKASAAALKSVSRNS